MLIIVPHFLFFTSNKGLICCFFAKSPCYKLSDDPSFCYICAPKNPENFWLSSNHRFSCCSLQPVAGGPTKSGFASRIGSQTRSGFRWNLISIKQIRSKSKKRTFVWTSNHTGAAGQDQRSLALLQILQNPPSVSFDQAIRIVKSSYVSSKV